MYSILECTQLEDPRLEWRAVQEAMLREYLLTAQEVLEVRSHYSRFLIIVYRCSKNILFGVKTFFDRTNILY